METTHYNVQDSIAALATPWGESALAVIRTSGNGAIEQVDSVFKGRPRSNGCKLTKLKGFRIIRGEIIDPETGDGIDDILAAVYKAPNSYTGEDSVELFVHGSLPGIQRILEILHTAGFRDANPGEFTLRAFLNGKLDLTRAEAVHEIVTAKSKQAQSLALHRLTGSIERAVNSVKEELADLVGLVELQLDYSEDEGEAEDHTVPLDSLHNLRSRCADLGATFKTGRLFQQGIKVVLAGKTNAGKSSLFNLFLKEDRSIVSEVHGTTRDYIESWISLQGIPILLYDTAGLRSSDSPVETEGIRRTEEVLRQADIALYIVDGTVGEDEEDKKRIGNLENDLPCIRIWNKIDCGSAPPPAGYIPLSTMSMDGFQAVEDAIVLEARGAGPSAVSDGGTVIDSLRQKELLDRAADALLRAEKAVSQGMPLDMTSVELQEALQALGEITGEVTSADILDRIFSKFCVGK